MRKSVVLAALAVLAFAVSAGETEAYINGLEGLKCASVPPPGIYFRSYELYYHADELHDGKGDNVHVGFSADVAATAQRAIWVTDRIKDYLGGANFGMHAIVPVIYSDVKMSRIENPDGSIGSHDKDIGIGDIVVSPVLLSWNKKRFDVSLDYELWMPTGDNDRNNPSLPGKGFWTNLFTLGATGYLDEERQWTISVLSRYELHSQKKDYHFTPGDDFHFEWGFGKSFKQGFEVGAVGYCEWQMTGDMGSGAFGAHFKKDRVYAAGVEGNYFIKEIGTHLSLRVLREFGAENRPEGIKTMLTFTKRF
jgi:hypothetical protein